MSGTGGFNPGKEALIYYSLSADNTVVPNDFVRLGAVRSSEFGPEWETLDGTADDSPGDARETLATFKTFNVSLNGISREEEVKKQDALEDHVISPPNGQPCGWIRVVRPSQGGTKTYNIPVLFTSFRITAPYDDGITWALESPSNGEIPAPTYA